MAETRFSGGMLAIFVALAAEPGAQAGPGPQARRGVPPKLVTSHEELLPGEQFPTGRAGGALAVGELDGDGLPDVVTAGNGSLVLLRGRGDGALEAPQFEATSVVQLAGLFVEDVDGDRLDDVLLLDRSTSSLDVWLSTSSGFVHAGSLPCDLAPVDLDAGDLNGDGAVDLLLACAGSRTLVPLLGDGLGGFTASTSVSLGINPSALAVADLDGDGHLDAAVAGTFTSDVTVLRGDGTGAFAVAKRLRVGARPTDLVASDLDGNGAPDLVAVAQGGVWIHLGDGLGGFVALPNFGSGTGRPLTVLAVDLDGDGAPDLVTGQDGVAGLTTGFSVLLGSGAGSFAAPLEQAGSSIRLAVADVNGDGVLDLLSSSRGARTFVTVFLGRAGGIFPTPRLFTAGGAADTSDVLDLDLDLDGWRDLARVSVSNDRFNSALGDGTGTFASKTLLAILDSPISLDGLDLDLDGTPDLVTANRDSDDLALLVGDRQGHFVQARSVPLPGGSPTSVRAGDLNGDGLGDVAVVLSASDLVAFALGDGRGGLAPAGTVPTASRDPHGLALGDPDLDGDLDLVVGTLDPFSAVTLIENDGSGGLTARAPFFSLVASGVPSAVAVEDLERDGFPDLLLAQRAADALSVLAGTGALDPGRETVLSVGAASPAALATGDLDADGLPEVVLGNAGSGNLAVFGGGSRGLQPEPRYFSAAGDVPADLRLADLDADGRDDVVVGHAGHGATVVLMGLSRAASGSGVFGNGTPGCFGRPGAVMGVAPRVGTPHFGLAFTNLPPASEGAMFLGTRSLPGGADPFGWGVLLHVDPYSRVQPQLPHGTSDASGTAWVAFGIPPDPSLAGLQLFAQMIFVEPSWRSCGPSSRRLVTTPGVSFTIR